MNNTLPRRASHILKRLAFVLVLIVPAATALAQPDTIPQRLQQTPFWMGTGMTSVCRGAADTVLAMDGTKGVAGIGFSTDGGRSFQLRDTGAQAGSAVCLTKSGPLWRLNMQAAVEHSTDLGNSWQAPPMPQQAKQGTPDGAVANGQRFWFGSADGKKIITTPDAGSSWDTLPFPSHAFVAWLDDAHGAVLISDSALLLTKDSGKTWDTLIDLSSLQKKGFLHEVAAIAYLKPGILATESTTGRINLSTDTGHTWISELSTPYWNIIPLRDSLWYATATTGGIVRSTNGGRSWNPINYSCPNGPGALAFWDTAHGIAIQTAQTSDGGYTWDCLDTAIYISGPPTMYSTGFDASAYYATAKRYGTNYLCLTTDRGTTWSELFPMPVATFLPFGHRLFFGYTGKVTWTDDFGKTFQTFSFDYDGNAGALLRAPDGTIWAGNELKLFVSRDTGSTWADESMNLPYRADSAQLNYTFIPVDSVTGFTKTSSGGIFRTVDTGVTWQPDSVMPTYIIDSHHWIAKGPTAKYTSDGGNHWGLLPTPTKGGGLNFFAVDSVRWLVNGYYTTDAGTTWALIPGWNNKNHISFTAVDSSTAFGGQLWRLDMPWYVKPQAGVATPPIIATNILSNASASPNPVSEETTISFFLSGEAYVKIEVFDILGNEISASEFESLFAPGNHSGPISLHGIACGTYYARIVTTNGDVATVKLVKE